MENRNRLTYRVSAALAGEILSQKLPVGAKLPSDTDLSEKYGVSRTVLREALRVLGAKGLITAKPRVGTLVAEANHWALWDPQVLHWLTGAALSEAARAPILHHALDMRLALEPALAALASSRASDDAKQSLQHALRKLQETPDLAHEQAFISCLYDISGNQFAPFASHLACWVIAQRQTPAPMHHYQALTAAIAQRASVEARQCAMNYLIGD